jgi:hypothetical protein
MDHTHRVGELSASGVSLVGHCRSSLRRTGNRPGVRGLIVKNLEFLVDHPFPAWAHKYVLAYNQNSMSIIRHEACTEPSPDTIVCRFIDLRKFRDLFANEELYFRRTDLFKEIDPNEGLPPDDYVRRALGLTKYDLRDELALNNDQASNRQFSEMRYIQCWQIFEDETLDMWARYGGGVAIFSRFDLLRSALDLMLDEIQVGLVRYGDAGPSRYNLIHFLFMKRQHFAKERELRTVLTCRDPVGGNNRHFGLNGFPNREPLDDENRLHEWVHEYKRRRIDLKALVTEVRLSPWATQDENEEVHTWVTAKSFTCPVKLSGLTSPLTPTLEQFRNLGR